MEWSDFEKEWEELRELELENPGVGPKWDGDVESGIQEISAYVKCFTGFAEQLTPNHTTVLYVISMYSNANTSVTSLC